jgi:glycosyltransferase involved in cell wall biosynthesis
MVHALVTRLTAIGHEVEVFTVGSSRVPGRVHATVATDQYPRIFAPLYDNVAIPVEHLLMSRSIIRRGAFDIVHDHNYILGPAILGADDRVPPVLHTLHGPFFTPRSTGPAPNTGVYEHLVDDHVWFNGISRAQLVDAPLGIASRIVGVVHNGIDVESFPIGLRRHAFVTLARFAPEKGHGIAARVCAANGHRLAMAGAVGTLGSPAEVDAVLADPESPHWANREVVHFATDVRPFLAPGCVSYVGAVRGRGKLELLASAKALLCPIEWDEPFGVAVVEAMACGTPVIAYRRGAMAELVDDGVTGFLVDDEVSFAAALDDVDRLNSRHCRERAVAHFSVEAMTRRYVALYEHVLDRSAARSRPSVTAPHT